MVQVQAAGFGAGIDLREVVIILELLFLALIIVNVTTSPNQNVFNVIGDKVLGYPVCKGFFCMLPSLHSLTTLSKAFAGTLGAHAGVTEYADLLFSSFDVVKGLLGFFVAIGGVLWAVILIYQWDFFNGMFRPIRN